MLMPNNQNCIELKSVLQELRGVWKILEFPNFFSLLFDTAETDPRAARMLGKPVITELCPQLLAVRFYTGAVLLSQALNHAPLTF